MYVYEVRSNQKVESVTDISEFELKAYCGKREQNLCTTQRVSTQRSPSFLVGTILVLVHCSSSLPSTILIPDLWYFCTRTAFPIPNKR